MTEVQRQYRELVARAPYKQPNILEAGRERRKSVVLLGNARIGGLLLIAPSGWGKSILLGKYFALSDVRNAVPQVIIDVGGQTVENFLHSLLFLPEHEQLELLNRVIYCDMAGQDGYVPSWPILRPRSSNESLYLTAARLPELLGQLDENFANATIQGLTWTIPIATMSGKILASLNLPITEVFDLLRHPDLWLSRAQEAAQHDPEVVAAADDLQDLAQLPKRIRVERVEPFLNRLNLLRHDDTAKAMFGSTGPPTIDFEKVLLATLRK